MIQSSPELERNIYDEGVAEAYRYNQLVDYLGFALRGLERYSSPGYFVNVDLQRKLHSSVSKNIAQIEADLQAAEHNIGELIGVDCSTGEAIGLVAASPYREGN